MNANKQKSKQWRNRNRPDTDIYKRKFLFLLAVLMGYAPMPGTSMRQLIQTVLVGRIELSDRLAKVGFNGYPQTDDPEIPDSDTQLLTLGMSVARVYKGYNYEAVRGTVSNWLSGTSTFSPLQQGTGARGIGGLLRGSSPEDEGLFNNLGDLFKGNRQEDGGFFRRIGDLIGDAADLDGDGDVVPWN